MKSAFSNKIFGEVRVTTSSFQPAEGVKEYHIVLHGTNPLRSFEEQTTNLLTAWQQVIAQYAFPVIPVFTRVFLSDAANQQATFETSYRAIQPFGPLSVVQQPLLDGTKVALWVHLWSDVQAQKVTQDVWKVGRGAMSHLWTTQLFGDSATALSQTQQIFNKYIKILAENGGNLLQHVIRTWFFVHDIDNHYAGVVEARNQVFAQEGLTEQTHYISSTGIGGRSARSQVLSLMDVYAVVGIRPDQMKFLYAPDYLNRTSEYGVSFERGTYVDYADRRHIFISGTASIDNRGQVLHVGDIVGQTHRMWENVTQLLAEADATMEQMGVFIVYLRDMADYQVVKTLFEERFPFVPTLFVQAPVCRPEWLIEMECMGTISQDKQNYPSF